MDNIDQQTQPEPVIAPSDASQQQPTQETQSQAGTPAQQAPAPTDPKWIFDGNFDKLKQEHPELMKYASGIRRYATTKDQEHAEKLRSADEYAQVRSTAAWQQFVQSYSKPQQQAASQEETFVDPDTQKYVEQKEAGYRHQMMEMGKQIEQLTKDNKHASDEREVQLFAASHPLLAQYDKLGLIRPGLREGLPLASVYERAEETVEAIRNEDLKSKQGAIAKKQNAAASFSNTNVAGDSDVIWVDNQHEVMDAAVRSAARGETNKQIRVRKK